MDPDIIMLIEDLRSKRDWAKRELVDLRKNLKAVEGIGAGGRWADVKKVDLEKGKTYLIRRSWNKKEKSKPCLAKWEPQPGNGWQVRCGSLIPSTSSDSSIDVWIPKKAIKPKN